MPIHTLPWNVYLDDALSGPLNMARDQYLLQCALNQQQGFIRLYSWDQSLISLGRTQRCQDDLNLAACAAKRIPLVRRITGGRAVLHGDDLTYAVAAPRKAFSHTSQPASLMDIYQAISQVFVRLFQHLQLSPHIQQHSPQQRARLASPICFATPSPFEVLHQGKKLLGSAQRMLPHAFLQHGSLPLTPQHHQLPSLFQAPEATHMQHKMTDLSSIGAWKRIGSLPKLQQLLLQCFQECWQTPLLPAQWQEKDHLAVEKLLPQYPLLHPAKLLAANSKNCQTVRLHPN